MIEQGNTEVSWLVSLPFYHKMRHMNLREENITHTRYGFLSIRRRDDIEIVPLELLDEELLCHGVVFGHENIAEECALR